VAARRSDVDHAALDKVARQKNVAGYDDLSNMLQQATPDIVVLATPSGLHASQTLEIAQAGCHVIFQPCGVYFTISAFPLQYRTSERQHLRFGYLPEKISVQDFPEILLKICCFLDKSGVR